MASILNTTPNRLITGTNSADLISNYARNVTIHGGMGNDTLSGSRYGDVFQFRSDGGNDTIMNYGEEDTIYISAGGLDTYYISGDDMIIGAKGTNYSGTLRLVGAALTNVKIKVQNGSVRTISAVRTISNRTRDSVVSGSEVRDSIKNNARNVTINAGDGNDTITTFGDRVLARGGAGDDYIQSTGGTYVTLIGGKGDDVLEGVSNYREIFRYQAGDGDDVITSIDAADTIQLVDVSIASYAADGDDMLISVANGSTVGSIRLIGSALDPIRVKVGDDAVSTIEIPNVIDNAKPNRLLAGYERSDSIKNSAWNVTMHGGTGNDTLTGSDYGEVFQFRSDGGDDIITNFGKNDTLYISAGNLSSYYVDGNDAVIEAKGTKYFGTVRLQNYAEEPVQVLDRFGKLQTIHVVNTIVNITPNTLVNGTNGNDSIRSTEANVTINGGKGDDTLTGSNNGEIFRFRSDGGNDVVTDFDSNDTLHIGAGSLAGYYADADDLVILAKGVNYSGTIRLLDAADKLIPVKVGTGSVHTISAINVIYNDKPYKLVEGKSGQDSIRNDSWNVTLHGGFGNDTLTGSKYGDVFRFRSDGGEDVITNYGSNDTIHIAAGRFETYYPDDGDVVIVAKGTNYTGTLRLKNATSIPINIKVGNGSLKTFEAINVIENYTPSSLVTGTSRKDSIVNYASGVTIHGLAGDDTITGADEYGDVFQYRSDGGDDVITNFSTDDTLFISAGSLDAYYADGDDMVIYARGKNYSGTIRLVDAAPNSVKVKVGSGSVETIDIINVISNTTRSTLVTGTNLKDSVYNYAREVTIDSGRGNDTIQTYGSSVFADGGSGNDSIRSTGGSYVTLHGGEGNDTLTGSTAAEIFQFRSDDGTDVITNFDANDTLFIAAGAISTYYADGDDMIVSVHGTSHDGTIRLKNSAANSVTVKEGDSNPRQIDIINVINNSTRNTLISGTGMRDSIRNTARDVTILGAKGNDTVISNGGYTSIEGGDGNDLIQSSGGPDVTMHGGPGNDTLYGSDEADVFVFRSDGGNDSIYNFNSNDTLYIAAGSLSTYYADGPDMIIEAKGTNYTGRVRLVDTAGGDVKIKIGGGNIETIEVTNVIENSTANTLIVGTGRKDSIINHARNVTLHGGEGNDTLVLSSEYPELIYFRTDGGNDVIYNFSANDTIQFLTGAISTYYSSGDDMLVSVRSENFAGSVSLIGAADMPILVKTGSGSSSVVETLNFVDTLSVIDSTSNHTLITGSYGRDSITADGNNVTIQARTSDDTIRSSGNNVTIDGGFGNDVISISGERSTMHGGAGDDTLYGSGVIAIGAYDGSDVFIGATSEDSIRITEGTLDSQYVSGNDYVFVIADGSAKSTLTLKDYDITEINLIDSDETLAEVTLANIIENYNADSLVSGTADKDLIYNYAWNATINGGADDDTIVGSTNGEVFQYSDGGGNDVIMEFRENDTLQLASGTLDNWYADESDLIISIMGSSGESSIRMVDRVNDPILFRSGNGALATLNVDDEYNIFNSTLNNTAVVASNGNDSIRNAGMRATIRAREGDDTIINDTAASLTSYAFGSSDGNDLLIGMRSNDTIRITDGALDTHYARGDDYVFVVGDGTLTATLTLNDSTLTAVNLIDSDGTLEQLALSNAITNADADTLISGTANRDFISNIGPNVTLNAGAGNDFVTLGGVTQVVQFGTGSGKDLVTGLTATDTIQLTSGSISSHYSSGSDYIIELGDSDALTLQGAAAVEINFLDTDGTLSTLNASADSSLLPFEAEDYWFDQAIQPLDEINSILRSDQNEQFDRSVAFDFDPNDRFKPSIELVPSARNRLKK